MIIGQTIFSVRRGTEHRAEAALDEIRRRLATAEGLRHSLILRSIGMSPLASDLSESERASTLAHVHYVVHTEWESGAAHDQFYSSEGLRRAYATLSSVLTSGPFEVLYEDLVSQREQSGVSI